MKKCKDCGKPVRPQSVRCRRCAVLARYRWDPTPEEIEAEKAAIREEKGDAVRPERQGRI